MTTLLFYCVVLVLSRMLWTVLSDDSLIKVFNEQSQLVNSLTLQSTKQTIIFKHVLPYHSTFYRALSGDLTWNITLHTAGEKMTYQGQEFKSTHMYGLLVHNMTKNAALRVLDVTKEKKRPSLTLGTEQALVVVSSDLPIDISLFGITENCYKCLRQPLGTVYRHDNKSMKLDTRWRYKLYLETSDGGKCSYVHHFEENWHYRITVSRQSGSKKLRCVLTVTKEGDNPYIPIAVMFSIFIATSVVYLLVKKSIWKRMKASGGSLSPLFTRTLNITESKEAEEEPKPIRVRLRSLDTFRGIAISVMIFVNYGGGSYYFFHHARWNGLTVADLVFPWFIFIMGTSILLSQKGLLAKGGNRLPVFLKTVKRSIILFSIGLYLNNGADLSHWRIPGVLQRFAISYLVVAIVNLFCSPRGSNDEDENQRVLSRYFADLTKYWIQWLIMGCILALHLLITFLMEVPDCPRGYLGPGGIGDYGFHPKCTGGAAGYIDRVFFGENHIYNHPTCKEIYLTTEAYDPEGILGSLTSIFLTFLGLQAGRILATFPNHSDRITRWFVWGVIWGVVAIGLSGGTKNGGVIPINKNLWSVSFVMATGSMAYILLAILYVVIDIKHWWNGTPLFFAGMNAILLYCGHEVFHNFFPFNFKVSPATHASLLARSAVGMSVWLLIAFLFYRKKIFLKV